MKCATHPGVETNLTCGKCGKPICPKCMVQTPVGARCPECARLQRLPTFRVSTSYYLRAVGVGLGLGIAGGLIWGLIQSLFSFFYLNLLLAPALGYAVSELLSRVVNRKRSTGLAVIAGAVMTLAYLVSLALRHWFPLVPLDLVVLGIDLVALALGILSAIRFFTVK